MARIAEPGGWDLLLEFFNDPEGALRRDAFAFAAKKTKGLETLEAALASRYIDVRTLAVEALVKKHTKAAQAALVRALDDETREVRLAALESIIDADARPELARALDNPHADIRLWAARALARHGDPAALAPLREQAAMPPRRETHPRTFRLRRPRAPTSSGSDGPPRSPPPWTGSASWATRPHCRRSSGAGRPE
jgi:ParB family chromosome partitioning protein